MTLRLTGAGGYYGSCAHLLDPCKVYRLQLHATKEGQRGTVIIAEKDGTVTGYNLGELV